MPTMKNPKPRLLAHVMGSLSEEYFCAGWMSGAEYALWADLTGQDVAGTSAWGITEAQKAELRQAHEVAGGWLIWSDAVGGTTLLSHDEWREHLAAIDPRNFVQ